MIQHFDTLNLFCSVEFINKLIEQTVVMYQHAMFQVLIPFLLVEDQVKAK